jgi:hypothetical protein
VDPNGDAVPLRQKRCRSSKRQKYSIVTKLEGSMKAKFIVMYNVYDEPVLAAVGLILVCSTKASSSGLW